MAKPRRIPHATYYLALASAWTPRLPFLRSKRFWIWTVSVYSISYLSLFISLKSLGGRAVETSILIVAALTLALPVQTIGMIVHGWIDRRRGERRGFEVLPADDEAA